MTPSSLVNYRELPIIIRTVKVFTIALGQTRYETIMQSRDGPTLSVNSPSRTSHNLSICIIHVHIPMYVYNVSALMLQVKLT